MAASSPNANEPVRLRCAKCGLKYKIQSPVAQKLYRCRRCGGVLSITRGPDTVAPGPEAPADVDSARTVTSAPGADASSQKTVKTVRAAGGAAVAGPASLDDAKTVTSAGAEEGPGKPGGGLRLANPRADDGHEIPREIPVRLGRYFIDGEVARGGMGVIYKGRQEGIDRVVAIKMMLPGAMASPEMVKRFQREARAAGKLQHPNIVAVHEVGDFQGAPFFTMDFIEGVPLDKLTKKRPLSADRAATIMRDVARAIDYAHSHGVVHRDIKPANVLLDKTGRPKITDFGLAKDFGNQSLLSVSGDIMGTPAFMSPEQAEGHVGQVDEQSDVYSLGAVLFMMITGAHPFQGKTLVDTLSKVVNEDPPMPATLNPEVETDLGAICTKAMEKDKRKRYATAGAMADDLDHFLKGEPVSAKPWTTATMIRRKLKRNKAFVAVVAAALLLVACAGPAAYWLLLPSFLEMRKEEIASGGETLKVSALRALSQEILTRGDRLDPGKERAEAIRLVAKRIDDPSAAVRSVAIDFVRRAAMDPDLAKQVTPYVAAHIVRRIRKGKTDNERIEAIELATRLKLLDAVEPLVAILDDPPSDRVLLQAVRALGEIPNRRCFQQLLRLSFTNNAARDEARAALDKIYRSGAVAPIAPFKEPVAKALARLHAVRQKRADRINELLNDLGPGPKARKTGLDLTIEHLESGDAPARLKAAYELGVRVDPKALPALIEALGDDDPAVGVAAADAIIRTGADPCRDRLMASLHAPKQATRDNAAMVLGKTDAPRARDDVLLALGRETDPGRCGRFVEALGMIGLRSAAPVILERWASEPGLSASCRRALTTLAGHDYGDDRSMWQQWIDEQATQ